VRENWVVDGDTLAGAIADRALCDQDGTCGGWWCGVAWSVVGSAPWASERSLRTSFLGQPGYQVDS